MPVGDVLNISSIGTQQQAIVSLSGALQGKYSVDNLTAVPNVVTLLGMQTEEDYAIGVFRGESDELFVQSGPHRSIATILEAKEACNGWYYKVNQTLRFSESFYQLPLVSRSDDSLATNLLYGSNCQVSLPEAMTSVPDTSAWLQIWNDTNMYKALRYSS